MPSKLLSLLSYLQIWTPDPAKAAVLTLAAGEGVALDASGGDWICYRYAFPSEVRRHLLTSVTNFRGVHSAAGVNYAANDTVIANSGRLYRCKAPHVSAAGNTPESGATWAANWDAAYPYFQTDREMLGIDPTVKQIILVNHNASGVVGTREGM